MFARLSRLFPCGCSLRILGDVSFCYEYGAISTKLQPVRNV